MNPDTTPTPRTDAIISEIDMDQAFQDLCRQLERELAEKTNEVARLRVRREKTRAAAVKLVEFLQESRAICEAFRMKLEDLTEGEVSCRQLDELNEKIKDFDVSKNEI